MNKKSFNGLTIEELVKGAGVEESKGKTFIGKLNNGEVFLSTYEYGRPWRLKARFCPKDGHPACFISCPTDQ